MDFTEMQPYGDVGHTWGDVAMSMNGQIMAATITGGNAGLYISTDGGANWTLYFDIFIFASLSMSDDGQTILAGGQFTYLTTDGGANWTEVTDVESIGACNVSDMTPNGRIIVVGISGGGVYRSDDGGSTWNAINYDWAPATGLSISSDGQKILGVGNNQIYLSVDGGASWVEQMTDVTYPSWYCCAMSKNGKYMLAGQHITGATTYGGRLYLYKSGAWAEIQPMDANQHNWHVVSLSDAGNVMFAGMFQLPDGSISRTLYSSVDYGATWIGERVIWPDYVDPEPTWNCITNRATTRILCGTNGKRLWLSDTLPLPPFISSFPWVGKFQLSHVP